jgi:chromosome segregation ATPase
MMFAFGNFIVCSSTEIGKLIAYSHLKCKCVTYDGDVLESGTLTGGFLNTSNFIIGPYE